ncbi:hypothetical protein DPMN_051439 [Dreissena polymorpha]|uniref:Uncharacterized protein n=1 Tax=Dreissena polymorpha TaxID=45954 RepID=A0A9D4HQ96_DREPO|nr:hypothetical protein DPMN_051439 [Dreissena polymorpha]
MENKGCEPFLPPVFPGVREWSLEVVDAEIPDLLGRERVGAFFRIEKLEPSICEVHKSGPDWYLRHQRLWR